MHVLILVLALKGTFCVIQLACGALRCSRSSSARDSSMTPCSAQSLFVLCVSWKWLLFVVVFLSDFEVLNGHGIEKKEVIDK
jgi:hypothetical protein